MATGKCRVKEGTDYLNLNGCYDYNHMNDTCGWPLPGREKAEEQSFES